MKTSHLFVYLQSAAQRIPAIRPLALAMMLLPPVALATPIDLGTAGDFAVLAGAGITNTGPTIITGDIGTHPTPTLTGFGSITLNGTNHVADAVTQTAKSDLDTAYAEAAARPVDVTYGGGFDLVGLTLTPGVYHDDSSLFLTGTLTLDGQGHADSVWVFQAGSTLITGSGSQVNLLNGAQACYVFWQVGSSATLGTYSDFVGNILASASITLNTGATVDGRVLARDGAVTLDANSITKSVPHGAAVPETGSVVLLFGFALLGLIALKESGLGSGGNGSEFRK